jgi:hypothetical protein
LPSLPAAVRRRFALIALILFALLPVLGDEHLLHGPTSASATAVSDFGSEHSQHCERCEPNRSIAASSAIPRTAPACCDAAEWSNSPAEPLTSGGSATDLVKVNTADRLVAVGVSRQ